MNTKNNLAVPVGTTTIAGYGATVVGIIGLVLVQLLNVEQEQALVIATAVWTVVSFGITQFGRYQQARELAKPQPKAPVITMGSGSSRTAAPSSVGPLTSVPDLPQGAAPDPSDREAVEDELARLQRDESGTELP